MKYPLFKSAILACIICCCFGEAKSQTVAGPVTAKRTAVKLPPSLKTPVALIDSFFAKYKKDGTGAAIDYLFGTNKMFNNEAAIAVLKAKLDSAQRSFGQYIGRELISRESAGASLVFYSYLVKFTVQPMRFEFMFYKPQNDWLLYRFKYDDQMEVELEEAGKINNKKP